MASDKRPTPKVKTDPPMEKVLDIAARSEARRDAEEAIYAPESKRLEIPIWEQISSERYYTDIPAPPPEVFQGLLVQGIAGFVVSKSGLGKSRLTIGMAESAASGEQFACFKPTRPFRTLIINLEDPDHIQHMRMYQQHPHPLLKENLFVLSAMGLGLGPLLEKDAFGKYNLSPTFDFIDRLIEQYNIELLSLDPVSMIYGMDENSNGDAAQFMAAINTLIKKHGVTIILVHHEGKERAGSMDHHSSRGASAFVDSARWVANLKNMDEKKATDLGILDKNKYLVFDVTKSNYTAMLPEPVYFHRGLEGRLEPTNIVRARMDDHVADLVGAYRQCGLELSLDDLFQGKDGKPVREATGLKNKAVKEAAQEAIKRGVLEQVKLDRDGVGTKKMVLRLAGEVER